MKRFVLPFLFLFLIVLLTPCGIRAQEENQLDILEITDDMVQSVPYLKLLQHNWLNLFPISAQKNDFKVKQPEQRLYTTVGDLRTQVDNEVQYVSLTLKPDGVTENDGMQRIQGAGNLESFFVTMNVNTKFIEPKRYGGCYLGYINEVTGRKIFAGVMNGSPYIEVKEKNAVEGQRYRIKLDSNIDSAKLTLIRIFDTTFVLVDDKIVRQFKDGDDGKFQLIYGPVLYRDGETAQCTFDDLYLRKVVN